MSSVQIGSKPSMRFRLTWLGLGYAIFAIPLAVCTSASPAFYATALAGCLLPIVGNVIQANRVRNGDERPSSLSFITRMQERRELGVLTPNVRSALKPENASFEETVTASAEVSNYCGRRLAVISVRLYGAEADAAPVLLAQLQGKLRVTDHVEMLSGSEIAICIPLLRDVKAADIVSARIAKVIRESGLRAGETSVGVAVYPMHGYIGADLLNHARGDLRSRPLAA